MPVPRFKSFRLKTLLAAVVCLSLVFGWCTHYRATQRSIAEYARNRGGDVSFDTDYGWMANDPAYESVGNYLWRKTLMTFLPSVEELVLPEATDDDIQVISQCWRLRYLALDKSHVTDRSVVFLERMHSLRHLIIQSNGVSAESAGHLQQALPECKVSIFE